MGKGKIAKKQIRNYVFIQKTFEKQKDKNFLRKIDCSSEVSGKILPWKITMGG